MPRGRPRKVKVEEEGKKPAQNVEKNTPLIDKENVEAVNVNNSGNVENNVEIVEAKKKETKAATTKAATTKDTRPTCQCCGKKIDSSVRTLNLTYLTSIAPYRFEVENENGLVKVCGECALELGKVIEAWMIEKGAKKKWSDL